MVPWIVCDDNTGTITKIKEQLVPEPRNKVVAIEYLVIVSLMALLSVGMNFQTALGTSHAWSARSLEFGAKGLGHWIAAIKQIRCPLAAGFFY